MHLKTVQIVLILLYFHFFSPCLVGGKFPDRGGTEKTGERGSCVQTVICPQTDRQTPQVNQWSKGSSGGGGAVLGLQTIKLFHEMESYLIIWSLMDQENN